MRGAGSMSDLVFYQPDPIEQERRRSIIRDRVQEMLAELERSGATRGEVLLTREEAPPFGGKLVFSIRGPKEPDPNVSGVVTLTSGSDP